MIISCDTCGVVAFDTATGDCSYCADVAVSEKAKAAAAKATASTSDDCSDLLAGSVAAVKEALEAISDVAQLDALAAAETVGKHRKGVLDAIEAREQALASSQT